MLTEDGVSAADLAVRLEQELAKARFVVDVQANYTPRGRDAGLRCCERFGRSRATANGLDETARPYKF